MKITLCYKDYDCKLSLASMKKFKQATGKDLWFTMLSAYSAFVRTEEGLDIDRQIAILDVVDFELAAELFDCVTNKEITRQEIEDAMYHSGWRTTSKTTGQNEPWTLELVRLAVQYDSAMADLHEAKKPRPATEQSEASS